MSRTPSDGNKPHTATVRQDSPFPTLAIVLAIVIIMLMGLALFSPLRDRLFVPPPPVGTPSSRMQSPAPPAVAARPVEPAPPPPPAAPQPAVVEAPLTLMPATPVPAAPPPAPAAPALSGEAALIEALRVGQISLASGSDIARWTMRWSETNGRGVPQSFLDRMHSTDTYLIRKDFTIPDGLYGAHSVIFILDKHAPHPRGNPGHSAILDIASGACMGPACYALKER